MIMTIVNRTLFSYLFCIFFFGSLWWSNPALCFCCNSFIFSSCENYAFLQLIITIVNCTFINYFVCMFFFGALWWSNLVLCFLFFPIFTNLLRSSSSSRTLFLPFSSDFGGRKRGEPFHVSFPQFCFVDTIWINR